MWQGDKGQCDKCLVLCCSLLITVGLQDKIDNNILLSSMRSQVARKKAQHFKVFQAIEDDSHLLDLLVIATSPAQKVFFMTALIKSLSLAFSGYSKEPEDIFSIFTTWFGQYKPQSNTSFPHITTALQLRQQYFIDNWFQK